jgi:hypothetical protein
LLQAVPTAKGQALADEYGIKFFETVCCLPDLHDTFSEQFFFNKKTEFAVVLLSQISVSFRVPRQT